MDGPLHDTDTIATSAHQLQRAAGDLQQRASGPDAVSALPAALAHLEEALERLSTSAVKAAQAVEDWTGETGNAPDGDALSPSARALRWHLFHLSARLRGARDGCPGARSWARELLREADAAERSGRFARRATVTRFGAPGDAVAN